MFLHIQEDSVLYKDLKIFHTLLKLQVETLCKQWIQL